MFAREQMGEYDPSSPVVIERPLAAGRPLSGQIGTTNYSTSTAGATRGIDAVVKDVPQRGHRRGESQTQVPLMQPTPLRTSLQTEPEKSPSPVPSRHQPSPVKSSLIKSYTLPRHFDPSSADLSDDDDTKASPPRALRRQAKSVTFDVDPQTFTYEMATPDPSSVASGSREGSYDPYYNDEEDLYDMDNAMDNHDEDSFDASLEDTDKTPVVLPEDWRGMSPEVADATLTANMDDVFKGEDMEQRSTPSQEWHKFRTASIGSDPDSRPLPPVPQFAEEGSRRNSANILDRVHTAQRSLPTLPQASSLSKSDILNMKDKTMTVEDRLRLMGLDDVEKASPDQVAREKARLQRHGLGIHVHEDEQESRQEDLAGFTLTKISRESILRRVKDRSAELQEDSMAELAYSPPPSSPPRNYDIATLDPDVPIPSREASDEPQIKEEPYEDFSSFHSLPAMYTGTASPPAEERSGSVVRHSGASRDDSASVYSAIAGAYETTSDEYDPNGPPTPRADDVNAFNPFDNKGIDALGLPDFAMEESDFQASLHSYMSSGPDKIVKPATFVRHESPAEHPTVQEYIERDVSPVDDFEEADRAETPESILHNPIIPATEEDAGRQSPVIPEPLATIKAPGTSLKTRPSLAPADIETMAATRRQVSGGFPPPVPEKSPKRLSFNASLLPYPPNNTTTGEVDTIDRAVAAHKKRRESFRPKLEFGGDIGEDLSLDLDKEFNRVIESSKVNTASSAYYSPVRESLNSSLYDFRYTVHGFEDDDNIPYHSSYPSTDSCSKKGYLMRQNTKVVVAKRNFSNETSTAEDDRPASADDVIGNPQPSPRKPQHDRSKSWTTEPWNGKARRKSLRSVDKKPVSGPAPPLPGQASALQAVQEDQSFNGDDFEDGVERGRLFVKVVGVKDLNLPLPQGNHIPSPRLYIHTDIHRAERTWFSLTLDNGLHCVTTSRLELGRSAPIGQEFELVVLNDLEFQLSLQTHIAPPAYLQEAPAAQSSKIPKSPVKKSAFSRFLASPKKKREQERIAQQQRLDDERVRRERQAAEFAARSHTPPSAWDLLHELVGEDGSFGRAYVSLKNHEESCFGRPITVDIPLFNEWAVEDPHISSSMKSKRGNSVLRRPPYQIGNLTLQLLYVPRPKGVDEEDMPKSMNGCIRDMAVAERTNTAEFEGFLSQQGGDCPVSPYVLLYFLEILLT